MKRVVPSILSLGVNRYKTKHFFYQLKERKLLRHDMTTFIVSKKYFLVYQTFIIKLKNIKILVTIQI